MKPKNFENLIKETVKKTFDSRFSKTPPKPEVPVKKQAPVLIKESVVSMPKSWTLKTEKLSKKCKDAHLALYQSYVEAANKISVELDVVAKDKANTNHSAFRSLKLDEVHNKNAISLHELYFSNISDLASEIHMDSLPYMRLARDWGTFDTWQFDFRATCLSAREGWAVCFYDVFKNKYVNCLVENHNENVLLGGIPVIVMDMFEHAYFCDYQNDKKSYVNNMMKEMNWSVIEARMIVAEKSNLSSLFAIQPIMNDEPEKMLNAVPDNIAPISPEQQKSSSAPEYSEEEEKVEDEKTY